MVFQTSEISKNAVSERWCSDSRMSVRAYGRLAVFRDRPTLPLPVSRVVGTKFENFQKIEYYPSVLDPSTEIFVLIIIRFVLSNLYIDLRMPETRSMSDLVDEQACARGPADHNYMKSSEKSKQSTPLKLHPNITNKCGSCDKTFSGHSKKIKLVSNLIVVSVQD